MENFTVFQEPQWKWLKATGAPQEGWTLPVCIYNGAEVVAEPQVVVPGEMLHFALSNHGPECTLDRFQILVQENRFYFCYDYHTKSWDRGSMLLWYWTQSNLPPWAKEVLK